MREQRGSQRPGGLDRNRRYSAGIRLPAKTVARLAVVDLPFRQFHPQRDVDVAPVAFLHVRLSVPGSGTYEASLDFLILRPYSRIRDDRRQWLNNQRFSPERPTLCLRCTRAFRQKHRFG